MYINTMHTCKKGITMLIHRSEMPTDRAQPVQKVFHLLPVLSTRKHHHYYQSVTESLLLILMPRNPAKHEEVSLNYQEIISPIKFQLAHVIRKQRNSCATVARWWNTQCCNGPARMQGLAQRCNLFKYSQTENTIVKTSQLNKLFRACSHLVSASCKSTKNTKEK